MLEGIRIWLLSVEIVAQLVEQLFVMKLALVGILTVSDFYSLCFYCCVLTIGGRSSF